MQKPKRPYVPPRITKFVFLPHTFRFGADPKLTVITGYLELTNDILGAVRHRRPIVQLGDPTALIVAYDMEAQHLHLLCIDTLDTQCSIRLRSEEADALWTSLTESVQREYHDTPEHLLNLQRQQAHLLPL